MFLLGLSVFLSAINLACGACCVVYSSSFLVFRSSRAAQVPTYVAQQDWDTAVDFWENDGFREEDWRNFFHFVSSAGSTFV